MRTTTYEILKSLVDKGLASYVIKNKKNYFEVVDPNILINLIEEKKTKLKEALPELMKLRKSIIEKPKVELYEGKEGLKTLLEDLLKNADNNYQVIGNNKMFREILHDYYVDSFINKRLKSNIFCEFIAEPGIETEELKKEDKEVKRKTKIMKELKNNNAEIFIYNNTLVIFTLIKEQPIGILIREKNIFELMENIFNQVWKNIEK